MKRSFLKRMKTVAVFEMLFLLLSIPFCLSYVESVSVGLIGETIDVEALEAAGDIGESGGAEAVDEGRIEEAVEGDMDFDALAEYMDSEEGDPNRPLILVCAVLTLALARVFRAFRLRQRSRVDFVKYLVFGCALACGAVLLIINGDTLKMRSAIGYIFWGTLLVNRVHSVVRKHRVRNILLNLIAVIFIVIYLAAMVLYNANLLVEMTIAALQSLMSIMAFVFARVNVKALKKIIRQTYAVEIIMGLLLLIVSFAYVLKFTEPNMRSNGDALWYCFAIVTTIGFGDITATTTVGRVLSVILGIYGIVVVALITSVIVNFYGEMKREGAEDEEEDEAVDQAG